MQKLKLFWRLLLQDKLALISIILIILLLMLAIFAPIFSPYPDQGVGKSDMTSRLEAPSRAHLFGTDQLGRDVLSRILFGMRISLSAALVVTIFAMVLGTSLGAIAGYFGGKVDELIMRIADLFLSFPALLLAIIIVSVLGRGLQNTMLALVISWWPWYTRLVRGITISLKERAFIEAARSIGVKSSTIIFKHIVPNCSGPIIVQATIDIGSVVLATAGLSFIGLGAQPPTPELGLLIGDGRNLILEQWWCSTFPGVFIFLVVLSFNLFGDFLGDVLDPRKR